MPPRISLFEKMFPVPQSLTMPGIGVDVSDESIKYMELRKRPSGFDVGVYGEEKITRGVIEAGVIKQNDVLADLLRSVSQRFPYRQVYASLPEEQAYVVRLALPVSARSHVRESVELQLEEHVPLAPRDLVFDYEELPLDTAERASVGAVVSVVPATLAASYEEVFTKSGCSLLALEIEAQAIARALVRDGDMETYLIVDFGKTRTGLSIVSGGIVRFTSTIKFGGDSLTESIQKATSSSFEDAEKWKKEHGLTQRPEQKEVYEALILSLAVLRDEVSKHYLFWNSHKEENGQDRKVIEKLLLCGGGADLVGLTEYLSQSINVEVKLGNPWVNVFSFDEYIPPLHAKKSIEFATAVGLALRSYLNGFR